MPPILEIDALGFSKDLQDTFRRYLFTSNMISEREPELQQTFLEKLNADLAVFHGPFVHCTPSYRTTVSLRQLVSSKGPTRVEPGLLSLPREEFDPDRPLYSHQVEALRIANEGKNIAVATGTGSGKTECFVLPILNAILRDPSPGLRAILIYPMNALADDQLWRFRRLLRTMPSVTFGRYTGDTLYSRRDGPVPEEVIPNERFTREEIRQTPPHILLTNFAMLEYLFLRPTDAEIFAGQKLHFVVLDEAHTYVGAQGIEIALLMRRLRQYLKAGKSPLQFILTSATLGDKEGAAERVRSFGRDLTGGEFLKESFLQGELIDSFAKSTSPFPSVEVLLKVGGDETGFEAWRKTLDSAPELAAHLERIGLPAGPVGQRSPQRLLFDLFSKSEVLSRIHNTCREKPSSLDELCSLVGLEPSIQGRRAVRWLVTMGAYAKRGPDSAPLLPTRLHFFVRGFSGATVCINPSCLGKAAHPGTDWSEFFLEDRNHCSHCGAKVVPLFTCVHCGLPVVKIFVEGGKWGPAHSPHLRPDARLLTWLDDLSEKEEEGADQQAALCLSCGAYGEGDEDLRCCQQQILRKLRILEGTDEEGKGNMRKCPCCGGTSGAYDTVLREFRTREEAPTAVLAETIVRNLPFDAADERKSLLPASGRNLLVFSDSRQRAAFFAPYLARTTAETAYRGPIERAIMRAEDRLGRPATLGEVSEEYIRGLAGMPFAVIRESEENGEQTYKYLPCKRLLAPHKSKIRREVEVSLYENFCASTKQRSTLQGMGIAAMRVEISDHIKDLCVKRVPEFFQNGMERGDDLLQALAEIFVQRRAVAFPDGIGARDLVGLGPEAYTFHYSGSGRIDRRQRYCWNPYRYENERYKKRVVGLSRQLDILARALHLDKEKDKERLDGLLTSCWDIFKEGILSESEQWPGEYRIEPDCIQVTRRTAWYSCDRCGRVTTLGSLGLCSSLQCSGTPKQMSPEDLQRRFERNHYRQRYLLPELPLEVKEHTAQLTNEQGKKYQRMFMQGEVNVLSSSTTFEMGIDVGDLKAVLLRNVPPTTSSYIQRAGRAGRRKDGVSVAVTFARNVPHDQYHYQRPEEIILGRVPPPYVNLRNVPLAQRHCNSALLGYFLRETKDLESGTLDRATVEQFFLQDRPGEALVRRFVNWCGASEKVKFLCAILKEVLPAESGLTPEEALRCAAISMGGSGESVLEGRVLPAIARFDEQMDDLSRQIAVAAGKARLQLSNARFSLERLKDQFLKERLIDFLSGASWLPGYAFPQDSVKLLVRQVDYTDRMRLERDREIGISEYAPGAKIVADGVLLRSGGVWFNSKEPDIRYYTCCPECRAIETCMETEVPPSACRVCGTRLVGNRVARLYLKPDGFTTLVTDSVERPGLSRPLPPRISEIFLLEGASSFEAHSISGITFGIRERGKLFRANRGYSFRGFAICRKCGRGIEGRNHGRSHQSPWGGQCSGQIKTLDLAHEIVTDILQIRFAGCRPPAPRISDKAFWLSLQAGFLNGVSDALGISQSDIGGTFHGWTEESGIGELVIYDRVPGGAGHIKRMVENLRDVLDATLVRVQSCRCPDIEASCYACLRNFGNQFYWDQLKRRPVIEWLEKVLS